MCWATITNENVIRYSTGKSDGWFCTGKTSHPNTSNISSPSIFKQINIPTWMYGERNLHQYEVPTIRNILSNLFRMVSDGLYKNSIGAACTIIEPLDQSNS